MSETDELRELARMADERGDRKVAIAAMRKLEAIQNKSNRQYTGEDVLKSASNFAGNIASMAAHPIDTAKGVANLVTGVGIKAFNPENVPQIPLGPGVNTRDVLGPVLGLARKPYQGIASLLNEDPTVPERTVEALGNVYKERYGGLENIKRTFGEDPIGMAADVSLLFGGAGAGLRASGLKQIGGALTDVSKAADPLYQGVKAVGAVSKPAFTSLVGTTTGRGVRPIEEALNANTDFLKAYLGKTSEGQVVDKARDALDNIKQARGTTYRARLANLKSAKQEIPIDDIKSLADSWLSRYDVSIAPDGTLDFSRSSLRGNPTASAEVKEVYSAVNDYFSDQINKTTNIPEKIITSQILDESSKPFTKTIPERTIVKPGKLKTPIELDTLKRTISNSYSSTEISRVMVTSLEKAVKDKIVKSVPEYAEMTKDYERVTKVANEIERALSLGTRSAADTALRKLTNAVMEDKAFRRDLLQVLDEAGAGDVSSSVSGALMRPLASKSLGSMAITGGSLFGGILAGSPKVMLLLPLASPKVVGGLSIALGAGGKAITSPIGRGTGILAYQQQRLNQQ